MSRRYHSPIHLCRRSGAIDQSHEAGHTNQVWTHALPCAMNTAAAKCPYCQAPLDKIPKAKTRRPACGEYISVRAGMPATQAQADANDFQHHFEYQASRVRDVIGSDAEIDAERARLTARFGKPAREHDVYWGVCNHRRIVATANAQWGSYRNTTLDMGGILAAEGRLEQAARFLLQVCYADLSMYPVSPLAPAVIDDLRRIAKRGGLSIDILRTVFISAAPEMAVEVARPPDPASVWPLVASALAPLPR